MEKTKVTKRDMFEEIKKVCAEREDIINFCNHEIDILNRKSASKSTKASEENVELTNIVIQEMKKITTDEKQMFTVTEILTSSEVLSNYICENGKAISNSKLTAILTKETSKGDTARIANIKDKKNSFYKLV